MSLLVGTERESTRIHVTISTGRTFQPLGPARIKGVYQSLIEWSRLHGNRPGFQHLIEAGLPESTFEAVVICFADRFPPDAVAACRETLRKTGAPEKLFVKSV
jgi:hypothetical protein